MQRHFDQELSDLKDELLRMSAAVEGAIGFSIEALKHLDAALAKRTIREDRLIDEMELTIDERCLDLLACRQPLASDLRFITMIMKITTDLERIADLAVDIAQRVTEIADKPLLKPLIDIPALTAVAQSMVGDALRAFVAVDVDLSADVIVRDRQADYLRDLIQRELIEEYLMKDATVASRAVALILIARHLERMCDHATNIAEDVIYMVKAKVVKHHPEKIEQDTDK